MRPKPPSLTPACFDDAGRNGSRRPAGGLIAWFPGPAGGTAPLPAPLGPPWHRQRPALLTKARATRLDASCSRTGRNEKPPALRADAPLSRLPGLRR